MSNAFFQSPPPVNEPVRSYAPGSPEKAALKKELARWRGHVEAVPLVIGGEHRQTRQTAPVVAPHDHARNLGQVAQASERDVQDAIAAAVSAQRSWSRLPWEDRAAVFLKAADLLSGPFRAEMNAATMLGQSKTVYQAEIDAACELADFWRFNVHFMTQIYADQPLSPAGMWNRTEARGLEGFVLAVAPFNFTSIALNLASAPALMGCAVLWKPAPTSTLGTWVGLKILEAAGLPPGVINLVSGAPAMIGEAALASPALAGIHFTGSTATFNHLWGEVGRRVGRYHSYPRLVGETGGKDFVFAHPSADMAALKAALVRGAFEYQGQKCSAASRAYVPRSLWAKLEPELVAATEELTMGDPEDFRNFMGAVIDQRSFDKIKGFIDEARGTAGVKVIAGGKADAERGFFIRPTLITTTDPRSRTMCEEIFGPVLTVHVYDDARWEETLTVCEQTSPYALTGAIFAQDRRVIRQMSDALTNAAGNFYINDKPTGAVVGQQPFGGGRASGTNDKAGSKLNLLRWTSVRTIKETFAPGTAIRYPHMDEA